MVRRSDELAKWVITSGERRWRVAKRAGLATIDCYFHDGELNQSEVLEQQLIENCLREHLKPIEETRGFASLMEFNGWTGKELAEQIRVPPARVSRALALLKLPEDIQQQVHARDHGMMHEAVKKERSAEEEFQQRLVEAGLLREAGVVLRTETPAWTTAEDIGKKVVAIDVFDKPSTCQKVWDRMLSGVVFDGRKHVL